MLQPSQLQEVSVRFPAEIAEVRGFLLRAGVPVDTRDALHDAVLRLGRDKSFHRDLGSHVWLLLHMGASVQEVLQVVALAAAGLRNAPLAQEEDAHAILGFVLAERRAFLRSESREQPVPAAEQPLGPVPVPAAAASPAVVSPPAVPAVTAAKPLTPEPSETTTVEPARVATPVVQETAEEPAPNRARSLFHSVAETDLEHEASATQALPPKSRRATIAGRLVAVLVCLIGLGLGGWWVYREAHDVEPSWTTSVEDEPNTTPRSSGPPPSSATNAAPSNRAGAPQKFHFDQLFRKRAPAPVVDTHAGATAGTANEAMSATQPAPSTTSSTAGATERSAAPIVRVPAGSSPAAINSARPLIPSGVTAAKAPPPPVPTAVLASRLGSPSANAADAVDDRVAGTKGYPRLLRRKSLLQDGTLVAGNSAPPAIGSGNSATARIPSGTVRSTALGITAGNLVYAPDPAYPAAAAQQRVSGQVTVQAMVDREGNVASARVVSGPPLLRDAAVNAVQRWRFKPFLNGGKAQTFTSTAVVDFQLQ